MAESKLERIKAAEMAADLLIEEVQKLREEALTAEGDLRDELLQIASGMEENAKLMKEGLLGMRREMQ